MKAYTMDELMEKLNTIKGGTFATVTFYSTPKTNDGSIIYKVTKVQVHSKVDHTHMNDYEIPSYHRNDNSDYLISKALKYNNNTGNTLIVLVPMRDKQITTTYYDSEWNLMDTQTAKDMLYVPKKRATTEKVEKSQPKMLTPNAKNILNIACGKI